jgi:hypothetical protein
MKWLREKFPWRHACLSRLCCAMINTLSFMDSRLAPVAVGLSLMLPIVFATGMLEVYYNDGKVTMETMFEDRAHFPGNFGKEWTMLDSLGIVVQ